MVKTLKELIDERILDLEITAGDHLFSDLHRLITETKIEELEWVRRMMKSETTIIDDRKYCVDSGEEIKDEVER